MLDPDGVCLLWWPADGMGIYEPVIFARTRTVGKELEESEAFRSGIVLSAFMNTAIRQN